MRKRRVSTKGRTPPKRALTGWSGVISWIGSVPRGTSYKLKLIV